jgi:hypothetical protein
MTRTSMARRYVKPVTKTKRERSDNHPIIAACAGASKCDI